MDSTNCQHYKKTATTDYPLNICGEALRLVLCLGLGLVPAGHLGNGLLEKFGKFQLSSQALLLLFRLHKDGF